LNNKTGVEDGTHTKRVTKKGQNAGIQASCGASEDDELDG
jgi:hypothetical protein